MFLDTLTLFRLKNAFRLLESNEKRIYLSIYTYQHLGQMLVWL